MAIRDEYERVVSFALEQAPSIPPLALGLTASVDDLYTIDTARMAQLVSAARSTTDGPGTAIARRIVERIRAGRGGELVTLWPGGDAWVRGVLGEPDVSQVGGNAAQASWALATVGSPALLALQDRSEVQLGVLDPRVLLASPAGLRRVDESVAEGNPTKWPHAILEFTKGTLLEGEPIPRTTRVMLRFSHEPLECDESFADYAASGTVRVAMLSGLATQPDWETRDVAWAAALATRLTRDDIRVHHELSEFGSAVAMRSAGTVLRANSVGLSLSELELAMGRSGNPTGQAVDLAEALGVDRLVVHADEWSFAVTPAADDDVRDSLILGNALAGARARTGVPSSTPYPDDTSEFTDDCPPEGQVRDGWFATTAPSPYRRHPAATVGLGDTFAAGLLLGDSLTTINL